MSRTDVIGVGVVGVGVAGRWYADILRKSEGARLVAALRSPGGDTAAIEEAWGVPCFDDLDAFLARDDLDAVVVATPSGQHYEQAKAALLADKHVLIEKPITLDLAHTDELIALADARTLRLGVTFQRRADPLFVTVKDAIEGGALGRLVLLNIVMPYFRSQDYYDSASWRGTEALDGGGVLMNQGIHLVDVAVWWGGAVATVAARTGTLARDIEVEDTVALTLSFANGALGSISGTTASPPGRPHSIEVLGTKGSLRIEGEAVTAWDVGGLEPPLSTSQGPGGAADPKQTSTQNHERIVADFVAAIREGRAPLVTGTAARQSLALIQAAYRSARTGSVQVVS